MKDDYLFDNYRLAEFYDDMYNYIEDFKLWKNYIKSGMNILELACGSGRLTKLMLENFENITVNALDYSKEMLDLLRKKKEKYEIKSNNKLKIIESDMRYYKGNEKYDLIIIPSNSLNHIEINGDMEFLLNNLYGLLNTGGYLVFDILNPIFSFLINRDKWNSGKIYKHSNTDKFFYTDEKSQYDYATQINHVQYRYYYCSEEGKKLKNTPIFKMNIKVRLYFPQEMDYYISKTEFKVIGKYEWYDKKPFRGKTSEQIYVLQK